MTQPVVEATLASVGLDGRMMDTKADPCTDFYRFACGGWLDATEIPADESSWMRSFDGLARQNELKLKQLLEAAATSPPAEGPGRQLGAFYAACMDERSVNALGAQPLAPLLARVASAKDTAGVARVVTELHAADIWPLFQAYPRQDPADASRWLLELAQGGLALPDRDYYLKQDAESQQLRAFYQAHVERMLALAGLSAASARRGAADVLSIETALAKVSKTRVEQRDQKGTYNRTRLAELQELAPALSWKLYFEQLGVTPPEAVNVTAPRFFEGLQVALRTSTPGAWQSYLSWHVVKALAEALSTPFVDESFQLKRAVTGQAEQKPRWRRCVQSAERLLGELVGQTYVATSFSSESKLAAAEMVRQITSVFSTELDALDWLSTPTRARARQKLAAMAYLIGYPTRWKTYDFEIAPKGHAANVLRAAAFEVKRELAKVGKPVDREEWLVRAHAVDAYYNPQGNQMIFPAGILQPPFYDVKAASAVNLGAIGMLVGHELTHGFDDEGSQYDAQGNLANWWEPAVSQRFAEKTSCLARQYSTYEPQPGLKLNGELTLGENIADLGGVKLAVQTHRRLRANAQERVVAGGYTEDQQLFLALGQTWCAKYRPEYERLMVQIDPHSPARFRVQGTIANVPEFAAAFSCAAPAPEQTCSIW